MACEPLLYINSVNSLDNRPIGIFDSGMGGLTVRAEIARALPRESLVYFGDGKNVPYGPRPKHEIVAFVDEAIGRLVERNSVKMIVIACNAATGAAIDHLRAKYDVPIIGVEPAVKPAALSTNTLAIGILATAAALKGELYRATAAKYRDSVRIVERVGEGFVELVENDLEDTPEAIETVRVAVEPMLDEGADRIVLGCTHYPFLAAQIDRVVEEWKARKAREKAAGVENAPSKIAGVENLSSGILSLKSANYDIKIVDSAPAVARRVEELLTKCDLHADPQNVPRHEFLSFAADDYVEHLKRKSEKSAAAAGNV